MRAKKRLGQHFLKDKSVVKTVIDAGNLSDDDLVLEIGPGKGVLTEAILGRGARVVAVEKDPDMVKILEEKFSEEVKKGKLLVAKKDIRDFESYSAKLLKGEKYKLLANIPYYITGEIIRTFLSSPNQPNLMVLLVQNEVADRIVAKDGKESVLSISVKAYGRPRKIKKVSKKAFSPVPKVDSAVLAIENINKDLFRDISEEKFFKVLKAGFAHKRKKFLSNLEAICEREKIKNVFHRLGIPENTRAEDVSLENWKRIIETTFPRSE